MGTQFSGKYPVASIQALLRHAERAAPGEPETFIATALTENQDLRFDNTGDSGNSFGLFMLNRRGRLASSGLTPQQAFDPEINARVSADEFSQFYKKGARGADLALRAQRPSDPKYRMKFQKNLPVARQILREAGMQPGSDPGVPAGPELPTDQGTIGFAINAQTQAAINEYLKRTEQQVLSGQIPEDPFALVGQLNRLFTPVQGKQGKSIAPPRGVAKFGQKPSPGAFKAGGGPEAHGTRSLGDWQSDNAYDIMGKAGQAIHAPISGVVTKISDGGDRPQFAGYGITVRTDRGHLFFKHLGKKNVSVGDRLQPGQLIGTLHAKTGGGPHLHLGAENRGFLDELYDWYLGR